MVAGQPNRGNSPECAAFKIKDCKLYVPVDTLSAEIDNKLLEQLKTGFKRTIKWNKYTSEMSNQTKNNLNYLINISEKKEETTLIFHKILCCCLTLIKMETQKIVNLRNDSENKSSKFATIK